MDNALIYFLQRMLQNTISLNFNYYLTPYGDISNIDIGLRRGLKNKEQLYDNIREMLNQVEHNHFYFYSDCFEINYIFFHPYPDREDLAVVGPFLRRQLDQPYFDFLITRHHLNHTELENIRGLLYQFPVLDDNFRLVTILTDIINYVSPGYAFTPLRLTNTREIEENTTYVPIDDYKINMTVCEQRYALEEPLLQAIAKGDVTEAMFITRQFMSIVYPPRINDFVSDKKASLYSTNTMLRLGAGRSNVHPVYLHELSSKFVKMISDSSSSVKLDKIHEKMVRDYCMLVQNKSRSQYSKIVRDTLNYIDFHLSDMLNLSVLAEYCHVSTPYLSKIFKKEVGSTITDYIMNCRIHSSLRLLSTSKIQIQEIAAFVGMPDFNYYTKIFKRIIGCSPSEYRKKLLDSSSPSL